MKNLIYTIAARLMIALTVALFFGAATGRVAAQSPLDGFDPNADGTVRAIVVQPDGKILIGGDFTTVAGTARNRIARLNPDGTLDTAFNPDANSSVYAIALQLDGNILVGGQFSIIGGQTRNKIARLDATTGAADSFTPGNVDFGDVFAIALQADGKVLICGSFIFVGGQTRNGLARLDAVTGTVDSWNPNPDNSFILSIAVQRDGKILVGGLFTAIGGQTRNNIARLDATTGAADISFNPNADSTVQAFALQADGKILVGGDFTSIGGTARSRIARLNRADGTADAWNPNASSEVTEIALQSDGKIIVSGFFSSVGGQTRNWLARLDAATGAADSFNPTVNNNIHTIALQTDGKILIGGIFTVVVGETRNRLARLERNGSLDRTLNLILSGNFVDTIVVQPDGKIIFGGRFTSIGGIPRNNIARLNADGTLDFGFNPNANGDVYAIAVQSDGKILVGGAFTNIAGATRNRIARLNADGTLDTPFNPNANSMVKAIALQRDGRIYAGGNFTSIGGAARNYLAELRQDNGQVEPFNVNLVDALGEVNCIIIEPDADILFSGNFDSVHGFPRNGIARVSPEGSVDPFSPTTNGEIFSMALQSNGRILIGGGFGSVNGQPRPGVARLDGATGNLDTAFYPNIIGDYVQSIAVQSDGKILIGGTFTLVNGVARPKIARLDATTGLPDAFHPNPNAEVRAIALQADGKILIGGSFTLLAGPTTRTLIARLSHDTAALQSLSVSRAMITWFRSGAASQFNNATFELSTNGGITWTFLGSATPSLTGLQTNNKSNELAPQASSYTLGGLNLPTTQNILIRARGYYQNGSETTEELVQNAYLQSPSAAAVRIAGRVMTVQGNGVSNAIVSLTDPSGQIRSARTSPFGYYHIDGVEVGQTYIVTALAKKFQFTPLTIAVSDELLDLDIIALP